jgi:hypothetical protein
MLPWFLGRGTKVSEAANHFGKIFKEHNVSVEFYNSIVVAFVNFDEFNGNNNKVVSNDVEYITQRMIDDVASKNVTQSVQRIDSYFYIYHRIKAYVSRLKENYSPLQNLQQKLFELLTTIFVETNGKQPNICLNDRDQLREINIPQHLLHITVIKDKQTLNIVFVLSKLSMQSSLITDDNQNQLKWMNIFSKTKEIKLSLEDFIAQYIIYKDAFKQFPIDIPAFILLIQRMHPPKGLKNSPFTTFIHLCQNLSLNVITFLEQFKPIFDSGVKVQRYHIQHIRKLLILLSPYNQLFCDYLLIYSSNVSSDELWDMYLNLSKISDLNATIRKHLITILSERISILPLDTFRRYTQLARDWSKEIKDENRPYFVDIFEQVHNAFVTKQLQDTLYSNRLTEKNLKELLNIEPLPSSIKNVRKPSYLLVIQQLLFKTDPHIANSAEKLKRLFQNLSNLPENMWKNNDPIGIIEDEWLKNFTMLIPDIWFKLDQNVYKYLCNNHQNNRWTIYIWSRIVHLSLLKSMKDNTNMILLKSNEWMKNVQHDVYNPNDVLTIIFVINLFELVIVNHTRSILSLPNIESIIKFIISIKDKQPDKINTRQVDDFIRNGCQELEQVLQLKGTFISWENFYAFVLINIVE